MKTYKILIIFILTLSSRMMFGQTIDFSQVNPSLNDNFFRSINSKKVVDYQDIQGSPYLNSEFTDGVFYFKDTTKAYKLPLRYNIYTDEMEYQLGGSIYSVGNPQALSKVLLGGSVFVYLPFVQTGGFFELYESGKCFLVQKKIVRFIPAEMAKPMVDPAPAKFTREQDIFYLVLNHNNAFKIVNMKSVKNALKDQKPKIENFLKQEKIKNIKTENLIKIVKYYNSL